MEMSGQNHAPAALPPENNPVTHQIGADFDVGIWTTNRPARSLASTPTASPWLPRNTMST